MSSSYPPRKLEIACFSVESAVVASKACADRIELCSNASVGGTTPELNKEGGATMAEINSRIPVHVMLRPRGGDFVYNTEELEHLFAAMACSRALKIPSGFVFGILTAAGKVDVPACKKLVENAKPVNCTFHRAFDGIVDKQEALEDLIECGFTSVLTSGGAGSADQNVDELKKLVESAKGRIEIMPGGGIRSRSLEQLVHTGAKWFHSSALIIGEETASAQEIARLQTALK